MYQCDTITDMRRLNITLDDETDTLLRQHVNQAETIREAIKMYHGGITTDTLAGLRKSYTQVLSKLEEHDESFRRLDKLINILESRM